MKSLDDEKTLDELLSTKHVRMGHVDQGRFCDRFAIFTAKMLHGQVVPSKKRTDNPENFINLYGRGAWWGITGSYHAFIYDGEILLRVWTRTALDLTFVDVAESLIGRLGDYFEIESIPEGSRAKCAPLVYRSTANRLEQVPVLVSIVKHHLGL